MCSLPALLKLRDNIAEHGMRLSVLERYWPHDKIVHGLPGQEKQLEDTITLIRNMGKAGNNHHGIIDNPPHTHTATLTVTHTATPH